MGHTSTTFIQGYWLYTRFDTVLYLKFGCTLDFVLPLSRAIGYTLDLVQPLSQAIGSTLDLVLVLLLPRAIGCTIKINYQEL